MSKSPFTALSGRLTAALILLALLAACSPSSSVDATLTLTASMTATPSPTSTSTVTPTATWTPRPTRTSTFNPTRTSTTGPVGTLTPTLPQSPEGAFTVALRLQEITPGLISAIYIPPQPEQIVLAGSFGLARIDLNTLTTQSTRFFGASLGLDPDGRAWIISPGGATSSAWIDNTLSEYGPHQGWVIPAKIPYTPISSTKIVAGVEKTFWLATATDVRRFENNYWTIYPATSIGIDLPYKAGVQSALTLAASSTTREAWAGSCNWRDSQIVGGGGLRYFDGRRWLASDFPQKSACILTLRTSSNGSVWAATDSDLWKYDPAGKEWKKFQLPALSASQRYSYTLDVVLSPQGEPCPLVGVEDSAGHPLQEIRFCLQGQTWQAMRTLPPLARQSLRFLPDGSLLSFEEGVVLRMQPNGDWQTVGEINYTTFAVGPDAQIWLVSDVESRPVVWQADLSNLH